MRETNTFEALIQDLRHGSRLLAKTPALTAVIIITLALGIGADTSIFSAVNAFLLRPLSVPHPEQIAVIAVQQKDASLGSSGFSYPEFLDFRNRTGSFADLFGVLLGQVPFNVDNETDTCFTNYVTGNFFSALHLAPSAGSFILPGEAETPGQPVVAVLGYGFWQRRFRGDTGVIGKQVLVNGKAATIIGVAPQQFQGMYSIFDTDLYLPMSAAAQDSSSLRLFWNSREAHRILGFARLKPGVTFSQAQTSLDLTDSLLAAQYPASDKWYTVRAVPERLSRPIPYANNSFIAFSGLFLILASFVLLLACMNVENILLARGLARQREMAIRAALGGSRARLIRQMLTESILLAILAGSVGTTLAVWANREISSLRVRNLPLHLDASFDWRVFTFALASALLTGILAGLAPALRASSSDVNAVLRASDDRRSFGTSRPSLGNFLVVAQVAGSLVLLVTTGLFVRSLQKVQTFDLGFDPHNVLNVAIDPQQSGYGEPQTKTFFRDLESNIRALPGVQSVSLASYVPMGGFPTASVVSIEGRPTPANQEPPRVLYNAIDPSYFQTMRISVLRGRIFADSDSEAAVPVAIINPKMAAQFWQHQDPIGKRFSMVGDAGPFLEIVGEVGDGKYQTVAEDSQAFFYVPLAQHFVSKRTLQIRSLVPPESLAGTVKGQVRRLAPTLPILNIETMQDSVAGAFGFFAFRLAASLSAALGIIGLILAVVGVYGVVSFAASRRTHEIGIRMALGADARDILHLVWKQGVRLVMLGVVVGIVAAWALARTAIHLLAGVSVTDPVTYLSVAALLIVVGIAACWIPARRAMQADPMIALRHE